MRSVSECECKFKCVYAGLTLTLTVTSDSDSNRVMQKKERKGNAKERKGITAADTYHQLHKWEGEMGTFWDHP